MAKLTVYAAAVSALLSGCAMTDPLEQISYTEYEVHGDVVEMRVAFDQWRAPDDADAEAKRLSWIDEFIVRNSICADGYEVTDRQVFVVSYAGQIHYRAQCKTV